MQWWLECVHAKNRTIFKRLSPSPIWSLNCTCVASGEQNDRRKGTKYVAYIHTLTRRIKNHLIIGVENHSWLGYGPNWCLATHRTRPCATWQRMRISWILNENMREPNASDRGDQAKKEWNKIKSKEKKNSHVINVLIIHHTAAAQHNTFGCTICAVCIL